MAKSRVVVAVVVAAGVAGALAFAGCSGGSGGSGAGSAAGSSAAGGNAAAGSAGHRKGAQAAQAAPGAAGRAPSAVGKKPKVHSPALIRTASLHVKIEHRSKVAHAADQADAIAVAAGGRVYADDRTAGKHASASLTLKVPPSALSRVLNRLAALGHETSRSSATKDVTQRVADVTSRTLSAHKSLTRLRALYTRATKVKDVIEIENEIASREAELESLEAQQRALDGETDTATIHLSLVGVAPAPAPAKHAGVGFLGGLAHGWHAFTTSVFGLLTAIGAVLPFLVVLAIVGAVVWWLRRRLHHAHGPGPEPPSDSS